MSDSSLMPSDLLRDIQAEEDANWAVTETNLGKVLTLVDELNDLYKSLRRRIESDDGLPDWAWVNSIFFLASQYEFEKSILDCVRGRLADSLQTTRRAIELAAFGRRVSKHHHLADLWMKASEGDVSYDQYRKKFSGFRKLFPESDEVLRSLGERFDFASKQVHGSPWSVVSRLEVESTDKLTSMQFMRYDAGVTGPSGVPRTFLWIIDTHMLILESFAAAFTSLVKGHDEWRRQFDRVGGRLATEKTHWERTMSEWDKGRFEYQHPTS